MSFGRTRTRPSTSDPEASPALTAVGSPAAPAQPFNEKHAASAQPQPSHTDPDAHAHDPNAHDANGHDGHEHHPHHGFHLADGKNMSQAISEDIQIARAFWDRFRGKDRWVGWGASFRAMLWSSPLNLFVVFIPIAWVSHFVHWNDNATFALCFLAIVPLEQMFDFLGEQMMFYLGKSLGELLIITLNNAVEATLAIVLLARCDLRLLQSSIAGVVLLHLLLIPGMAFLTGGARILEQNLHEHNTQLNHSLLTIGVLAMLIPTAFFAALDRGVIEPTSGPGLVSDGVRHDFLQMSRGMAVILLIIYIASRIYLHNPPGENNALMPHNAPAEVIHEEKHLATARPEVNVWAALLVLALTIGIMAFTAEMLVESIEHVREEGHIRAEWFGLVLLPVVSFAADGTVATIFFARYALGLFLGKPEPPKQLAKGRAIDMSIQFVLFWLPFLVLLGWWTNNPLHMLFDLYEVALLLGACFLVNAVTADSKTNWVEGLVLVGLYIMLATATWWYPGQESARWMLRCVSVALADEEQEKHTGGSEFGGVGEETEGNNATEAALRLGAKLAVRAARRAWEA